MVLPALFALKGLAGGFLGKTAAGLAKATQGAGQLFDKLGLVSDRFNQLNFAAQNAFAGVRSALQLLTQANDQFEQSVLSSTGLLANSVDVTNILGQPIAKARSEILALKGPIDEIFKGFEQTALELVGITSTDLINAFNVVTRNFSDIKGQSKIFKDDLDAAAKLSERFAVSLKALGLPAEQLTQEIRSFLIGDVSTDSVVSQSLGFNNAEIRRLKSSGDLVDEFIRRTETLAASSDIAADTFAGASSNVQDFFGILQREATVDVFDKLSEATNNFFDFLQDNKETITSITKEFVNLGFQVVEAFGRVLKSIGNVLVAFGPILGGAVKVALQVIINSFNGLAAVLNGIVGIINVVGDAFNSVFSAFASLVSGAQSAVDTLAKSWASFTGEINKAREAFEKLKKELPKEDTGTQIDSAIAEAAKAQDSKALEAAQKKANDALAAFDARTKELEGLNLFGEDRKSRDILVEERKAQRQEFEAQAEGTGLTLKVSERKQDEDKAVADLEKLRKRIEDRTIAGVRGNLDEAVAKVEGPNDTQNILNAQRQLKQLKAEAQQLGKIIPKLPADAVASAQTQLARYQEQIDSATKSLQALGIAAEGTLVNQKLVRPGELIEQERKELENLTKILKDAQDTGRGDLKQITTTAQNIFNEVQTGLQGGIITFAQARKALEEVVRNDFVNTDLRAQAFEKLSALSRQTANDLLQVKQLSDLQVDIAVESGDLSRFNGEIIKARNNYVQFGNEIKEVEALLAVSFDPSKQIDLQNRLNELKARQQLELSRRAGLASKEAIEQVDRQLAAIDRRFAKLNAERRLALQQSINKGELTEAEAEFKELGLSIREAGNDLRKLRAEARGLEQVTVPTDIASRQEFLARVEQNRINQIEKQNELLKLQKQASDKVKESQLRLLDVQLQITSEIQSREALREERTAAIESDALERQLSLLGAISELEEARGALAASRVNIELQEALELQALLQKRREGTLTSQERKNLTQLQKGRGESELQVADRIFKLKEEQINKELEATNRRLESEVQIFNLEQKKLELAFKQEEIAARRAAIEAKSAEQQLLLEREKIKADKSLTGPEREQQLKLNEEQLKTNQELQALEAEAIESLKTKQTDLLIERGIRRETLETQQQQTRQEAEATAGTSRRANSLEREKSRNKAFERKQKEEEQPQGQGQRPQENPQVARLKDSFRSQGFTITPAGGVSSNGSLDFGRTEQLRRLTERNPIRGRQVSGSAEPQSIAGQPIATTINNKNTTVVNNFPDQGASRAALRLQGV